MTHHYRLLTKEEIARLEAQHCIASDWSGVEVADDFHTDYIHHTRFSGKVRLGVFEKEFTLAGGMAKHSGVYYATLHNVTVGDNCYIENVKNYIVEENKNNELIYGLKSGKTYYVKVRAVAQGGGKKVTGKYGKAVKFTTYVVPKVKKISVKNNKKGMITITASKVKGAAGQVTSRQ